jgi:uncharacterized membrane protein
MTNGPARDDRPPPPAGSHRREGPGLEFDRVSFFTDAVFAIAMTLLVVELEPPRLTADEEKPGALLAAVVASWPQIFGFFLGFALLGRYWMAHHDFFANLRSIDRRLISLNLAYLAFIAFMPYPVALISNYEENAVAFALFAVTMAIVSTLEVVMYLRAVRCGHMRQALSPEAARFGLLAAGAPVVVMVASLPLAAVSTTLALLSWLVLFPVSAILHRRMPAEFRRAMRGEAD